MNLFSTCGDENISIGRHHMETYPEPPLRNYRKMTNSEDSDALDDEEDSYPEEQINFSSFVDDDSLNRESNSRTARKTEGSEKPKLKLDRPFLYFVRHNPTGLILHMGRFNPRITEKTQAFIKVQVDLGFSQKKVSVHFEADLQKLLIP